MVYNTNTHLSTQRTLIYTTHSYLHLLLSVKPVYNQIRLLRWSLSSPRKTWNHCSCIYHPLTSKLQLYICGFASACSVSPSVGSKCNYSTVHNFWPLSFFIFCFESLCWCTNRILFLSNCPVFGTLSRLKETNRNKCSIATGYLIIVIVVVVAGIVILDTRVSVIFACFILPCILNTFKWIASVLLCALKMFEQDKHTQHSYAAAPWASLFVFLSKMRSRNVVHIRF